uniref:Uncharacterized protein n=1 Tax=Anguilla anguilla TaxID=7936 RepID=A0A0E9T0I6_ANGAN
MLSVYFPFGVFWGVLSFSMAFLRRLDMQRNIFSEVGMIFQFNFGVQMPS